MLATITTFAYMLLFGLWEFAYTKELPKLKSYLLEEPISYGFPTLLLCGGVRIIFYYTASI